MGGVRLVTLGGEITEPGGAMIGGSRQKMKTGFGGKIHGAGEVEKLVGEVERLSLMAQTVASALREARTRQNDIRGRINALAENDSSIKASSLRTELEMAQKTLNKAKENASKIENRLDGLESAHSEKLGILQECEMALIEAENEREKAAENLRNSSPDEIKQRLLEAQTRRVEAEGIATKAQVTLESGKEKELSLIHI